MASALHMRRRSVHLRFSEPRNRNGAVVSFCFGNDHGIRHLVLDSPQHCQDSDVHETSTFLVAQRPETNLEEVLTQNLTEFLLALGFDFAFLWRQKRLGIDDPRFELIRSAFKVGFVL